MDGEQRSFIPRVDQNFQLKLADFDVLHFDVSHPNISKTFQAGHSERSSRKVSANRASRFKVEH